MDFIRTKKVLAGLSMSALILTQGVTTFAYTDVPSSSWYADEVADFVAENFLDGSQARFRGADPALRAEFIKLIVELNGGLMGTPPAVPTFDDVAPGAWYFDYFEDAAEEQWVQGDASCAVTGASPCFARPGDLINRAEAAALINRSFVLVGTNLASQFVDNPTGQWYTQDIQVAADNCVLMGDGGSRTVRPGDNMNRAEMVVMLHRANQGLLFPDCGEGGGIVVPESAGIDSVTPVETNKLEVEFTVDIDSGEAQSVANYEVDGLTVTNAKMTNDDVVELTFDTAMSPGESYMLFVHGETVGGEGFDDSASFLGYRQQVPSTGELEVSMNPNTPIGDTIPKGSVGIAMLSLDFTANCEDDILVEGLTMIHEGQGSQADIKNAWMSVNGGRVSRTRVFDSEDQTADLRFSRPLLIEACDTVTVDFMADFESTAATNGRHNFVLELTSDVETNAQDVTGNFPVRGETFEIAAVSSGKITVKYRTVTPSQIDVNDQDALIGKFEFSVDSVEDQTFYSVTLENTGTASDGDFVDIFVQRTDKTALTDTVSQTVADYVTLTFDPPFTVLEGDKITLEVVADIIDGAADTVKMHFEETNDIFGVGSLYGYGVNGQLYGSQITISTVPTVSAVTINAGELTIDIDGPTTEDYTPDADDIVMANIDFVTGGEDINVNEMFALIVGQTSTGGNLACGPSTVGDSISEVAEDVEIRNTVTGQTVDGVKVSESTTTWPAGCANGGSSGTPTYAIYRFDDFQLKGSSRWELRMDFKENTGTAGQHPTEGDKFKAYICTADENDETGCDFGSNVDALPAYNFDAEGLTTGDVVTDIRPGEDLEGNFQEVAVASLTLREISLGSTSDVVAKALDVPMFRFQAVAGRAEDIFLTQVVLKADTGSLSDAHNYTLWVDDDNDGTVDNILQSGQACDGECTGDPTDAGQVVFDELVGGGKTIYAKQTVMFEVHADIRGGPSNDEISIGFDDNDGSPTSHNFVEALESDGGTSLVCTSVNGTNGTNCTNVSAPQILLTSKTSEVLAIRNAGTLFITSFSSPRDRQLQAGALGDSILELMFEAQKEPISVERLVFTNSGATPVNSISKLELYRDGETDVLVSAEQGECESIFKDLSVSAAVRANSFCASLDSSELIISPGTQKTKIVVRPRIKTDADGAMHTNTGAVRMILHKVGESAAPGTDLNESSTGSVIATGFDSQNPLKTPTVDGTKNGEIFVGVDRDSAEVAIVSQRNDIVLAKILTIEDADDAAITSVDKGSDLEIAKFKFTTAEDTSGNIVNTTTLSGIIFQVTSSNVDFDNTSFQLGTDDTNTNDLVSCTASGTQVSATSTSASGTFFVTCYNTNSQGNTTFDLDILPGDSVTVTLEADVTNADVANRTSSYRVYMKNFNNREKTTFDDNESHIRWTDSLRIDSEQDNNELYFGWIEHGVKTVSSTYFQTIR